MTGYYILGKDVGQISAGTVLGIDVSCRVTCYKSNGLETKRCDEFVVNLSELEEILKHSKKLNESNSITEKGTPTKI